MLQDAGPNGQTRYAPPLSYIIHFDNSLFFSVFLSCKFLCFIVSNCSIYRHFAYFQGQMLVHLCLSVLLTVISPTVISQCYLWANKWWCWWWLKTLFSFRTLTT